MKVNLDNEIQQIELKYSPLKFSQLPKITGSSDIVSLLRGIWDPDTICLQEEFKVILMTKQLYVLGVNTVNRGSLNQVLVDIPHIIKLCLLANASRIILAHNHPGGTHKPSDQDFKFTNNIKKAADLFEISVSDHIILTSETYYSFADNGHL